ncbi:hypothetical protein JNM05_07315 [bacterium]|nr:hypothetical protein [bacterium]
MIKKNMKFVGEVVETFDLQGKRAAKICADPHIIEIVLQENEEAHLGDKVIIEAAISVTSVKPFIPETRGEPG